MINPGHAYDRRASARLLTVVAALYLLFAFYGSWVPLHFVHLPLGEAIREFAALPFMNQRIDSATDWATNLLLLIPLSFLWAQRFVGDQRGLAAASKRLVLLALGVVVACALEFSQLYFPSRTVSQKDILALSLGVLVGSMAQYRWGVAVEHWFPIWIRRVINALAFAATVGPWPLHDIVSGTHHPGSRIKRRSAGPSPQRPHRGWLAR